MSDSARVVLAPLRADDAVILFEWINNRELVIVQSPFHPVSWNEHMAWFTRIQQRSDTLIRGIRLIEADRLIGSCQLHSIDTSAGTAELQIRIGDAQSQGRGFGTEAVRQLVDIAFRDLSLRTVRLQVFEENPRAIHVYEKAGFVRDGVLENGVIVEGRPINLVEMSIRKDA